MKFEEQMKFTLDRGNRSYRHMIDFAKYADMEMKRVKEVYQIASPVVKDQIKNYQELHEAAIELKKDLLMRASSEINEDGSTCRS